MVVQWLGLVPEAVVDLLEYLVLAVLFVCVDGMEERGRGRIWAGVSDM